jgi:hypothetical protein
MARVVRAAGPRVAAQRQGGAGPPLRHDRHGPRRLPPRPGRGWPKGNCRRGHHHQRRRPRHDLAGAFRAWLLTRGEPVHTGTTIRAMVPVSVHGRADEPRQGAHRLLRRPAGRRAPRHAPAPDLLLDAPADGGRRCPGADTLAGLGGFAPPTMHALGARLGGRLPAASTTSSSPTCPGRSRPCMPPGARDGLDLPGDPAQPRSGPLDRADLL